MTLNDAAYTEASDKIRQIGCIRISIKNNSSLHN